MRLSKRSSKRQQRNCGISILEAMESRFLLANVGWTGDAGDTNLDNPANWQNGRGPTDQDTAVFDSVNALALTTSADLTWGNIDIKAGTFEFNLNGKTLTADRAGTSFSIGSVGDATVSFVNGTLRARTLLVGAAADKTATLTLGLGLTAEVKANVEVAAVADATGNLDLNAGATLTTALFGTLGVGSPAGSTGSLKVEGLATLSAPTGFVGTAGRGTFSVTEGTATIDLLKVQGNPSGVAVANITGGDSNFYAGQVFVGTSSAGTFGRLTIKDGASAIVGSLDVQGAGTGNAPDLLVDGVEEFTVNQRLGLISGLAVVDGHSAVTVKELLTVGASVLA